MSELIDEIKRIQNEIASDDSISNGNHYKELQRRITNIINIFEISEVTLDERFTDS